MKRRRAVAAILIVIVLFGIGIFGAWYGYLRPWTIRDLMDTEGLAAGATRDLEGTITGVFPLNSSQGPLVGLELDGNRTCQYGSVFGDPGSTYRIGDRFRTTLRFRDYSFNGQPGVWAPELLCPFPWTAVAAVAAVDSISLVGGTLLRVVESRGEGWSVLEVAASNGTVAAGNLSLSVRVGLPFGEDPRTGQPFAPDSASEWIVLGGAEYAATQALYRDHPEVDRMDLLTDGGSLNGTVRYSDVQGNGRFDVGDRLELELGATGGAGRYVSFVLVVFDPRFPTAPLAVKYLVHGPEGPIEWCAA